MSRAGRFAGAGPSAAAFAIALAVYAAAAGPMLGRQSVAPHYVYLAEGLLRGRLDLVRSPNPADVLVVEGKQYVAGSPLPALLLAPAVAALGAERVSDAAFGTLVGALAAGVVQAAFGSWWLTLLFALGTPQLYLSALGSVWFNAHVVAVLFGLLALREALGRRRWGLVGLWLALGGFARPTLLFGAVGFGVWIALSEPRAARGRAFAALGAAVVFGAALHGGYNAARFGSPLDFGYGYLRGTPRMVEAHARYGAFHPRFAACNLWVSLLGPPQVAGYVPPLTYSLCDHLLRGVDLTNRAAAVLPNPLGQSVFLATPALLLLLLARPRGDPRARAAWAGLLAVMAPLWLYHNTGSVQYGYRYAMDAAPFWLLLLAPLLAAPRTRALRLGGRALVLASVASSLWGLYWMRLVFAR